MFKWIYVFNYTGGKGEPGIPGESVIGPKGDSGLDGLPGANGLSGRKGERGTQTFVNGQNWGMIPMIDFVIQQLAP